LPRPGLEPVDGVLPIIANGRYAKELVGDLPPEHFDTGTKLALVVIDIGHAIHGDRAATRNTG